MSQSILAVIKIKVTVKDFFINLQHFINHFETIFIKTPISKVQNFIQRILKGCLASYLRGEELLIALE